MAKVLLVEDDNNLREIYEARLQAEGYTINSAKDGEEALVVAKAEKPDLIISDVMMPKISCFEMLDILRNTQGLKETKVIMLTALGQSDDRTRADSLGADRYLVKSQVTLEDIVKAAHELLEDQAAPAAETPAAAATPDAAAAPAPAPAPEPMSVATPTTDMPVSEPPTAPSTTDNTAPAAEPAAPAAAPVTDAPATDTPVTPPAATDDAAAAPAEPQATPNAGESTVIAPTVVTPQPETAPAPEVNASAEAASTTPESAPTEASFPKLELPSFPTDEPAAQPAAESPAVLAPAPEATPAPAPAAPELPNSDSAAEEQATVNSQIEDFIKNNAVEVPEEVTTTPPPNANTDRVMQESVDTLIASTEHEEAAPAEPAAEAPAAAPEAAPAQAPAQAANKDEDSDNVTIAHKKVIPRPGSLDKPNLGDLLAKEQSKAAPANDPASAAVISPDTSAPEAPSAPAAPGQPLQPGNTITPKTNDDSDPNSIAL